MLKKSSIFEKAEEGQGVTTTLSGNGSLKYTSSGNAFVDDFASLSKYLEPRSIDAVFATMEKLWNKDALTALKEEGYVRGITRQPIFRGEKLSTLRAQGLKSEAILRLYWVALNHPNIYKKNLPVFVAEGSWKDLFSILECFLTYNEGIEGTQHPSWKSTINFILSGLKDPSQRDLIKKYLPTIRSIKGLSMHRQCSSFIGRAFAIKLYPDMAKASAYKAYRKLKASGTAHEWEQLISRREFSKIPSIFNKIAGRALSALVKKNDKGTSFLERHNLVEAYDAWVKSKPILNFTGYAYELMKYVPIAKDDEWHPKAVMPKKEYIINTFNKQFNQIVTTAKNGMNTDSSFICAIDVSLSMTSKTNGTNFSAYQVALSMALYFSELLTGQFHNKFIQFSTKAKLSSFKGETPIEKLTNFTPDDYGSTNFLAVAKIFANLKKIGIDEDLLPKGVICISDGEFNRSGNDTNFHQFMRILRNAGFSDGFISNFKIVLWDIPNNYYGEFKPQFESLAEEGNFFYMSGFDGSGIAFLTGTKYQERIPRTAEELFEDAMNQELLNKLSL